MATYKLIKGGGELAVAAIIAGMITFDAPAVQGLLHVLRQHVYRPWSAAIAEAVTRNITIDPVMNVIPGRNCAGAPDGG